MDTVSLLKLRRKGRHAQMVDREACHLVTCCHAHLSHKSRSKFRVRGSVWERKKLLVNKVINVSCLFAFERRVGTIVTQWKEKYTYSKIVRLMWSSADLSSSMILKRICNEVNKNMIRNLQIKSFFGLTIVPGIFQ